MSVTYINRKGDTYYLHQGTTKKGNPNYYFAKKEPDAPVETIPDGYEIYENPNAQVFLRKILRKIRPKLITDDEMATVRQGVKAYAQVKHFLLDVKKNAIIITERYCFRGSIDDWIQISAPDVLEKLVRQFVPHLGQESFYELH